jgi:hypothetical protein
MPGSGSRGQRQTGALHNGTVSAFRGKEPKSRRQHWAVVDRELLRRPVQHDRLRVAGAEVIGTASARSGCPEIYLGRVDDKALAHTIASQINLRRGLCRSGFIFSARFGFGQRPRKCL